MTPNRSALVPLLFLFAGCSPDGDGAASEITAVCRVVQPPTPLEGELEETSGLALSRSDQQLAWTHNDSGADPEIHAVRTSGELVGTVHVTGADNRDWEDISSGPCPAGDCLYIGDIGDNLAVRDQVVIYRIPEPNPAARVSEPAEAFPIRYPGGPSDAESLFVLPDGELYIVTKGRTGNVALYRYPQPFRPDTVVEMVHVANLTEAEAELPAQITSAESSVDGRWVAVRSYASLLLYPTEALLRGGQPVSVIDLAPLGEPQGEAVAMRDDGEVLLTSEEGGTAGAGSIAILACRLPES